MLKVDTSEFKDKKFLPHARPDIFADYEAKTFHKFAIPEDGPYPTTVDSRWLKEGETAPEASAGEGFGKVEFVWGSRASATKKLGDWQRAKKRTEMVQNMRVSEAAKERISTWTRTKT